MDESLALARTRRFIREAGVTSVPVDLDLYLRRFRAQCAYSDSLTDIESGRTIPLPDGSYRLIINANHVEDRQRFTIAHEVAHLILEEFATASEKRVLTDTLNRYTGKSEEERICDLCAAELLMPEAFIKAEVENLDMGFERVRVLAKKYKASLTSCGLRFAEFSLYDCALIISEDGFIRYVKPSPEFRERGNFITIGKKVEEETYAYDIFKSSGDKEFEGKNRIPSTSWLDSYRKTPEICFEDSIFLKEWNQVLSLVWLEHEEDEEFEYEEEGEMDGVLRFKKR